MTVARNTEGRPLSRPARRVLFHLSRGGSLIRLRCRKKGYPKHIDPNRARYYWLLTPAPGELGWHCKEPRPRITTKKLVEQLAAAGYLDVRPAAEEIEQSDVTERGHDILEAVDADGYWLKPNLSNLLNTIAPAKGSRNA